MSLRAVCVFLAAFPLWAGDVRVDVHFTPAAPSLSDAIRMEVTIAGLDSAPAGSDLILRPVDIPPDCVVVRAVNDLGTRQILTLDPVKPGPCTIPAFRTRCIRGRTDGCDVRSAETSLPIGTLVANPNQPEIRDGDETPVEFYDRIKRGESVATYVPWLIGLGLVAMAAGAAFRIRTARRRDPARIARMRLKKLLSAAAFESDPSETFALLTTILREYLDQRLALGANACSSPELIDAIRSRSIGQGSTAQLLTEFLASCDRAKFSRASNIAAIDIDRTADDCLTLIQCLDFDIRRRSRAGA